MSMERTQSRNLRDSLARPHPVLTAGLAALLCVFAAAVLPAAASGRPGVRVQKRWVYEKQARNKREDREISAKEGRNPRFRYFKGEYASWLLERIRKDTGDEVPGDAYIFALRTSRLKEASVFIVKIETGDDCGDRYNVFKRTRRKFTELLGLRCVDGVYLTRKKSTTNGLPDLVYLSKQKTGAFYSTTFRFDGATYVEHECQVGKADADKPDRILYETMECKGRGIIRD